MLLDGCRWNALFDQQITFIHIGHQEVIIRQHFHTITKSKFQPNLTFNNHLLKYDINYYFDKIQFKGN